MTTANRYPYAGEDWLLHHHPKGGQIKRERAPDDASQSGIWDVTPLAISTLLLCDGTRTLEQVLREVDRNCEGTGFSALESASGFLVEALKLGVLRFQDAPQSRPLKVKGSQQVYYPLHVSVELTDVCNLRCPHCYREAHDGNKGYFPTDALLEVLRQMRDKGVVSLEFSGGEPTLHPDFQRIIAYALENFGALSVLTNGTTGIEELPITADQAFREKAMVQVDLDGCTAGEHERLRGQAGSFEASMRAIRSLAARGVRVRAAMVIYPGNLGSIELTYRLAKQLGATWFAASPVISLGRAPDSLLLSGPQLEEAIRALDALSQADPEMVRSSEELKRISGKLSSNCGAGSRAVVLAPDGQMRICFLVNKRLAPFKNVLDCGVEEALRGAPLEFFHTLDPPGPEYCGECSYGMFCGGCVARPLIAWERAVQSDPAFQCAWSDATGFGKFLGVSPQQRLA